ncbi:MAG: nucleotidyltransferase domain-containing protein, partial [Candidatus Woesearchaeota archaeon]
MKQTGMDKLLDEIRKENKPSAGQEKVVDDFVRKINALLKKNRLKAACIKGGSFAKDTFLKDDFDVDLFVKFSRSYKDSELSSLLGKAIKSLKPEKIHGSRDYYQLLHKKLFFEIVPVYEIKNPGEAVNVTDASPLHVAFVNKHLKKNP